VKNATEHAKKLRGLLRRTRTQYDEKQPTDPVSHLIYAFCLWETTRRQAHQAYNRLMKQVVDANDLRVSDTGEIVNWLTDRYSRAQERVMRLREVLHAIYVREHGVTLDHLFDKSKRDARAYLESLPGMVPFVAASVMLNALDGHAIPVDEQLVARLKRDDVADPDASLEEVQAFLEHQIKAADALKANAQLRTYVESGASAPASSSRSTKTAKKTTKKSAKHTTKNAGKRSTKTAKKTSKKKSTKTKAAKSRSTSRR